MLAQALIAEADAFVAWNDLKLPDGRDRVVRHGGPATMSATRDNMDKITLFGFLIVATSLEAVGDAVVRLGINQSAWMLRGLLFAVGAILLFGYGLSVNLAPVEFGRVVGLYIATLFVVWQLVNWIVFESPPIAPILVGGALIVAGGAIVTFWK